jgi:Tol biopolymer transport system component
MATSLAQTQSPALESASVPVGNRGIARVIKIGEWLLLLAAVAYIGGRALPRSWSHLNTDFPNYYITGRLLREGSHTNRMYEWIWLQRQKDRMGISASDQPLVGFVPDTPFSALVVWPLTSWSPLAAKRIWILINLALLALVAVMLRSITQLPWRRLALLIGLCYPLLRNFEYGQFYLVVLALVTLSLWCYLKDRHYVAGMLMGIAGGLKIFPVFFALYFVRKRNVPAVVGLVLGLGFSVIASLLAFGVELHRTYLVQILPWALRGEALDPYNLAANSISSLLHKLFLFEPGWNPHPLIHAPAAFAVLHPLLQLTVLAPAIFLIKPASRQPDQLRLEWSSFLIALLAISTLPSSYHFTLLLLPVAVLASTFLGQKEYRRLALLLLLYVAICFPAWQRGIDDGWWAMLAVPRLYFMLLLCLLSYIALAPKAAEPAEKPTERWAWAGVLCIALAIQIASTLHHQRGVYDYNARIATPSEVFLAADPAAQGNHVDFVAMLLGGFRVGSVGPSETSFNASQTDQLSISSSAAGLWVEEASRQSRIVYMHSNQPTQVEVNDAGIPVASPDGKWLAYLRFTKGAGALWLRSLSQTGVADSLITPASLDVEETTFLPDGSLVFSAAENDRRPALYRVSRNGNLQKLDSSESRYPAASPDGRWLAYSQLDGGVYHLWLRDLGDGTTRRITSAQCNSISPAWQADSKTLVYASDCGRALWFTALYRQRVIP